MAPEHLRTFGHHLQHLVAVVAANVGEHQTHIEQANCELTSVQASEGSRMAKIVLGTIAQVMHVNQQLQSRLSAAKEKLQRQAREIESHINDVRTDPMTGLLNRRAFDDELVRRIAEWRRKKSTFCLMMVDVDRFKALNDRYGHPCGDTVLRRLAEVLQETVREMDVIARVGGEEFAVVLPSTSSRDARTAAERIRATIANTAVPFEQAQVRVTVSLGVAAVLPEEEPVSLLGRANEALYVSKRSGRNCGHFHTGQSCEKITFDGRSTAAAPDAGPTLGGLADPDRATLCDDLRHRLSEVMDATNSR